MDTQFLRSLPLTISLPALFAQSRNRPMTYEESVHLEAVQNASKLVSRPLIPPVAAGAIVGGAVWLIANSIFEFTRLETFFIVATAYVLVSQIVGYFEKRFRSVVNQEFYKIYGKTDA
jgi:hypothetical protein